MSEHTKNLYASGWRYDLFMGAYAEGQPLDFYRRQIARSGQPVLELACGTGRYTIPLAADAETCGKIKVLSVAHLIGEAIRRTHEEESISSLFV